jgi:hypothetical protein
MREKVQTADRGKSTRKRGGITFFIDTATIPFTVLEQLTKHFKTMGRKFPPHHSSMAIRFGPSFFGNVNVSIPFL